MLKSLNRMPFSPKGAFHGVLKINIHNVGKEWKLILKLDLIEVSKQQINCRPSLEIKIVYLVLEKKTIKRSLYPPITS